ncbi:MAG: response regulator [Gammaproteobacteria bacterium]|nr:response regulator [Gammaproteobacteria bacterium]
MSRILIADDNQQNMYLVRFLLERAGYDVDEVENGKLAVEACEKTRYDLVLMDIQMPVMDGLEATRIIKRFKPAPLIVALTAFAMKEDIDSFFSAGCDGYITKPIETNAFMENIADYIKKAKDISAEASR